MGMWKKNPNHLNKYKGGRTVTEKQYRHEPTPLAPLQLDQRLQWEIVIYVGWIHPCSLSCPSFDFFFICENDQRRENVKQHGGFDELFVSSVAGR